MSMSYCLVCSPIIYLLQLDNNFGHIYFCFERGTVSFGSRLLLIEHLILQAQSASVAEIWLWQVGSWKAVGRLQSHSLTVTQMEFSYDDSLLLAVSRDRQFSV